LLFLLVEGNLRPNLQIYGQKPRNSGRIYGQGFLRCGNATLDGRLSCEVQESCNASHFTTFFIIIFFLSGIEVWALPAVLSVRQFLEEVSLLRGSGGDPILRDMG
jgi:hypothetical protein